MLMRQQNMLLETTVQQEKGYALISHRIMSTSFAIVTSANTYIDMTIVPPIVDWTVDDLHVDVDKYTTWLGVYNSLKRDAKELEEVKL